MENNQTKENRTNKEDLPTYLTTEKVQWEGVAPRNQGKRKGPLRTRNSRHARGGQTPRHSPQPDPPYPTPEKQAEEKGID